MNAFKVDEVSEADMRCTLRFLGTRFGWWLLVTTRVMPSSDSEQHCETARHLEQCSGIDGPDQAKSGARHELRP